MLFLRIAGAILSSPPRGRCRLACSRSLLSLFREADAMQRQLLEELPLRGTKGLS